MSESDTRRSGPRVTLVTGGSSGIGAATALRAARRGDHVVLMARGAETLESVAADCRDSGAASATALAGDVGDDAAVAKAVAEVMGSHGRLDLVVSNAGVVAYGRTEEVPPEVFEKVVTTNLLGSVNLARHTLPVLREQAEGSLVLVGSIIGHITVPGMSPYVLSKWGVRALAHQLQVENRDVPGVRIGYVAPGGVDTPIYAQAANYTASAGRPPFPVISADQVAVRILGVAEGRARSQTGISNDVIRFGHTAVPFVYDALVGPLFRLMAQDLTRRPEPGAGNVLTSHQDRHAVEGGWPSALVGLGRNLRWWASRGRGDTDT